MMRSLVRLLHAMQVGLLRSVSRIVPSGQREEWYREWITELSYVRQNCVPAEGLSWPAAREQTAFCLGSFQDAVCLRRLEPELLFHSTLTDRSPLHYVFALSAAVVLCISIADVLPGVQSEIDATRNQMRSGVVLIERQASSFDSDRSISLAAYRDWSTRRQHYFKALAFYRTESAAAEVATGEREDWTIAHTSTNFFQLMGLATANEAAEGEEERGIPRAMLSQSTWRRVFHSDPAVIGERVTVGGRSVQIAGVAPDSTWRLPVHPNLWLLEPQEQLAQESQHASGYVVAQLSSPGRAQMAGDSVSIFMVDRHGYETELRGVRVVAPAAGILQVFILSVLLALLALPAVLSVFTSDSSFAPHRIPLKCKVRALLFLMAKFGLVGALGYFGSIDIAYCTARGYSASAETMQLVAGFGICLVGLRWALTDQSLRCPICLRKVTHPAHVGIASCSFLGWNGTEMICMGGHALLHVPDMPTSWFSAPRWLYLDSSWECLFSGRGEG